MEVPKQFAVVVVVANESVAFVAAELPPYSSSFQRNAVEYLDVGAEVGQ